MNGTVSQVLQFVTENDVKFIRLAFCDIFGVQKNISIMPQELPRAFSTGISFDASAVKGFMNVDESDLFIVPDPSTLSILPWRPSQGRVIRLFCNIRYPNGRPFEGDGRYLLQQAEERAAALGYVCRIGPECEFYLFETDEHGDPTLRPHDRGGYCDIAPGDRGENVRREICLTLEEMGIQPESSHHEQGPGQNEVDFKYGGALAAADNLVTFKSVVKMIAARSGLYASFMPKPILGESGSGLHVNLSILRDGVNLFKTRGEEHSWEAESFLAGILAHSKEMTAFLNPLVNSYERFGEFEAPRYLTWSHQNRSQLIRIPAAGSENSRMELRSPDPACNPHLAFSLLLFAGLDGIEARRTLPEPANYDVYAEPERARGQFGELPRDLNEALEFASKSEFIKGVFPQRILRNYCSAKQAEWLLCQSAEDRRQMQNKLYFSTV